jgi:hypothetical protein
MSAHGPSRRILRPHGAQSNRGALHPEGHTHYVSVPLGITLNSMIVSPLGYALGAQTDDGSPATLRGGPPLDATEQATVQTQ